MLQLTHHFQLFVQWGQNATKRKSKGKGVGKYTNYVDLTSVEEAMREINVLNAKLVTLREKELENEYYDILRHFYNI